ncbi:hypothetical protein ACW9IB_23855 [Pseudomonas sp. SDO524_S393]
MKLSALPPLHFNLPPNSPSYKGEKEADAPRDSIQVQHAAYTSPLETRAKRSTTEQKPPVWSYSDRQLLQEVKKHFDEYATGRGDEYVNFNELKEAAGQVPTTRTFSPEASAIAEEILKRPRLLNQLDIGVGWTPGGRGLQDERFDHANLDYLIRHASTKRRVKLGQTRF